MTDKAIYRWVVIGEAASLSIAVLALTFLVVVVLTGGDV